MGGSAWTIHPQIEHETTNSFYLFICLWYLKLGKFSFSKFMMFPRAQDGSGRWVLLKQVFFFSFWFALSSFKNFHRFSRFAKPVLIFWVSRFFRIFGKQDGYQYIKKLKFLCLSYWSDSDQATQRFLPTRENGEEEEKAKVKELVMKAAN